MKKHLHLLGISICCFVTMQHMQATQLGIFSTNEVIENRHSRIKSAEIIADVAGFGHKVFTDSKQAATFDIVFLAEVTDVDDELIQTYTDYVQQGGILLADYYSSSSPLQALFGITSVVKKDDHQFVDIAQQGFEEETKWLDEVVEQRLWLRDSTSDKYNSFELLGNTIDTLGRYNNMAVAISHYAMGKGHAYYFGFPLTRVNVFMRLSKLSMPKRSVYGFEPNGDIVPLLVRGIAERYLLDCTWKHTIPNAGNAGLIISHDVDARSGYDTTRFMLNCEIENNISAHYFLTTRYFKDAMDQAYYLQSNETTGAEVAQSIVENGFTLGSHSVGHFNDFNNNDRFPAGDRLVTRDDYAPYHDGERSYNGTVYGEVVVSKQILESDAEFLINSFRPGHLLVPKALATCLNEVGYKYCSAYKMGYVGTCFPFNLIHDLSSNNDYTNVLEMPLSFSDSYSNDSIGFTATSYPLKVREWIENFKRQRNNGCSAHVLIHPTRQYKVDALKLLLDTIGEWGDVEVINLIEYAKFWNARRKFDYTVIEEDGVLHINLGCEKGELNTKQAIVVANAASFDTIKVSYLNGDAADYTLDVANTLGTVVCFCAPKYYKKSVLGVEQQTSVNELNIYPNPADQHVRVEAKIGERIDVFTLRGVIAKTELVTHEQQVLNVADLATGVYVVRVQNRSELLVLK